MIDLALWQYLLLFFLIYIAGFIDSIAGGGGLVSLASYYAMGLPPVYALGNNKFASTFGTLFATGEYIKNGSIYYPAALTAAAFSFAGSLLGANIALYFSDYYFRYLMLILVPVIAFLTLRNKDLYIGKRREGKLLLLLSAFTGFIIGIYDGFFGPGTGTFLTLAFTALMGFDVLTSCGNTKLVNLCSNIAALITFILNGNIIYRIGIPCVLASILGNLTGAHISIKGGGKIVKPILIVALILLMGNIIYSFF